MIAKLARRATPTCSVAAACIVVSGASHRVAGQVAVDQGPDWTPATRNQFYSQDRGSQIMPLVCSRR